MTPWLLGLGVIHGVVCRSKWVKNKYIGAISDPLSSHEWVVVGSYRAVGAYCQLQAHFFLPCTTLYYPVRLVYGVLDTEIGK